MRACIFQLKTYPGGSTGKVLLAAQVTVHV